MTEAVFFQDLAIMMAVAGLVAAVFSRLGWPKVIGYILAGVLMSQHTWGGSFLTDASSISTISELGVVFLMFGMGLSFSPKEMRSMKSVALPAAVFDVVMMILLGYAVGTKLFGWSAVQSVFLGVAICDSATTMLAKVFDEMGWMRRMFVKYTLGTSVCEDILCVGAIAVVTGFATGGSMDIRVLGKSIGGLAVFFLSVLVFGFILVPRLLKSVAKRKDDEALVLTLLGVCFFIAYFAMKFDFSLALGAFLVGMLGSVSEVRTRLGDLVDPLKSMFSAMFFVTIGLMVNPAEIWHCLPQILLVSGVVIVGKLWHITAASLVCGLDVKTAVQTGFSLAQIGEFAFMVAILYAGIVHDSQSPLFQIAVGASLLTTLVNPLMIKLSDPVGDWVVRTLPEKVKMTLTSYRAWLEKIRAGSGSPAYVLFKASAIRLCVYAVLMLSVSFLCGTLYKYDYSRFSELFEQYDMYVFFAVANFFTLSLLPLVVSSSQSMGDEVAVLLTGEGTSRWQVQTRQLVRYVVLAIVCALFFLEWCALVVSVLPMTLHIGGIAVVITLGVGFAGWKYFVKAGRRATQRFQEALTAEERREGLVRTMTISVPEGTVQRLKLGANSPAVGENVVSLNVRAKTGASVVSVHRGGEIIRSVGPELTFQSGDVLVAIGEPQQIAALRDLLGK